MPKKLGDPKMTDHFERDPGTLLPIVKSRKYSSTDMYSYTLRLTPYEFWTSSQETEFLDSISYEGCWFRGSEKSKKSKDHSHSFIVSEIAEEDLREKVREFLRIHMGDEIKRKGLLIKPIIFLLSSISKNL